MGRWAGDTVTLEDIEGTIDAAAFDPDRWHDVAAEMATLHPGLKISFMALYDDSPVPCTLVNAGWSKTDVDRYVEHFGSINPWVSAWRAVPVGVPLFSDNTYPRTELIKTEFYNDWLRRADEADGATGIKLAQGHGRLANVALHYGHRHSARMHPVMSAMLWRLGPRMARALEANRLLAGKETTKQMRPMIERFRDAAIAVDRTGRVVASNAVAQTLVSEMNLLRIGPGDTLHFVSAGHNQAFRQRLAVILGSTDFSAPTPQDMSILHGAKPYVVSFLAISSGLDRHAYGSYLPLHFDETLCLLVFRETPGLIGDCETSMAGIERYKLTRSEARVVLELCQGGSLKEIAVRLDIAYDTLRTHLKRIYEKTGAKGQRDLVRLFMQT
ncbi:helix-turn-helix transcriptional regulator [Microvirga sp. 3-52]|nr:helix-turn-helix transcriptional regulator [Microvirga sp. 3-52]